MRRHKKLMSLLLILTMITTMTPAIAFAAPNEPVEIKSVTITGIERPVDAEHPDFTAVIPEGAPYHFASREELEKFSYAYIEDNYNGIWWESVNGKMKPYELFEKGEIYTANMVLVPNDGYVFTSHVKVTINGETSHAGSYNDNMIIYSNDMEAASNHSQIADYSKVYAAFKKVPDNLFIYVDETVTKLNDACNAVKGGLDKTKQEEVDKMASDIETAIKGLEFKTEINSVEITDIKNPVIGENPVYSASLPENAPYHFASHEELIKAD